MNRKTFLTLASIIALCVGVFALTAPAALLASKGVGANAAAAAEVWVREVGLILIAVGVTAFLVKGHPDTPTLRAFLIGNAVLQLGLLPIEIVAFAQGVIASLSGIVPSSVLHFFLAGGFCYFASRCSTPLATDD